MRNIMNNTGRQYPLKVFESVAFYWKFIINIGFLFVDNTVKSIT